MQYIKTQGLLIDTDKKEFSVLTDAISLSSNTKQFSLFNGDGLTVDADKKTFNFLNGVFTLSAESDANQFKIFDNGVVDKNCIGLLNTGSNTLDKSVSINTLNSTISSNSLSINSKNSISKNNSVLLGGLNEDIDNSFSVLSNSNKLSLSSISVLSNSLTASNKSVSIGGTQNTLNNSTSFNTVSSNLTDKSVGLYSTNSVLLLSSLAIGGTQNTLNNYTSFNTVSSNLRDKSVGLYSTNSVLSLSSFGINSKNSSLSSSFDYNSNNTKSLSSLTFNTTNSEISSSLVFFGNNNKLKNNSTAIQTNNSDLSDNVFSVLSNNIISNKNSSVFNSSYSTISSNSVQFNGSNNFVDNKSISIQGSSNFVTNSSINIGYDNNKVYDNSLNIDGFNNLISSNSVAINSSDSNLRTGSLAINTLNSGVSTNSILINNINTNAQLSSIGILGNNNVLNNRSVLLNGLNNTILTNSLAFNTNNSSVTGNSVVLGGTSNIVNDFSFVVSSSASKAYSESSVIGGKGNTALLSAVAIGSINTQIIGQNSQSIGGLNNNFNSSNSVFLGGQNNAAANIPNGSNKGDNSFIIGGNNNKVGSNSVVIGGNNNLVQNKSIVVGGSGNNTGNFSNVVILGRDNIVVDRNNIVYLPEIRAQGNLTISGNISAGGSITNVNTTTGNVSAFNLNNYLYDIVSLTVDQNRTPLVGTLDTARFNYFGQPRLYVNNTGVSINTSSYGPSQALTVSGNVSATGDLKVDNTLLIGTDTNLYRSSTNTLKTDDTFVVGNVTVPTSLVTGTTDTIVTHSSNTLQQRTINSRVWDTAATFLSGSGTTNTILKTTGPNTIGNSNISDNGSTISVTGNLNVDSNTLYVDSTNNRTGILTTTPNETLTVSGSISAKDTIKVTGGTTNSNGILFGTDTNLYRSSTNTLKTDDTFVVGNVTVPTTLSDGTTDTVVIHSSNTLQQRTINSRVWGSSLVDGSGGTGNFISKWTDADTITNSQIFDNGTNVGINTSTPNARLTVVGDISCSSGVFHAGPQGGTNEGGQLTIMDATGVGAWEIDNNQRQLRFFRDKGVANITAVAIVTSGNVGINTTIPNEKLTVSGNVSATGNLTVNGDVVLGSDALDTLTFNGGPVNFPNATSSGDAIVLGGDVNLYRDGANNLRTNDNFTVDGNIFSNSNAIFVTNSSFPQYLLRSDVSNNNRWGMWLSTSTTPTIGNPLQIGPQDTAGTGNALLTLTRTSSSTNGIGNVGIGIITPDEKLTVLGNIKFGTQTNKATLTYTTNTARTYTIPDAGANADFVMNAGNQTIAGTKTFSSDIAGSITGNSATATKLQTARTINDLPFDGTSNISISAIKSIDNRTAAPSAFRAGYATVGFGSWNNNNTGVWADYIAFRTFATSAGGNDNMLSFNKTTIGMRLWQAPYGSNSAFSTYKDIAFTDGTNATGTWPISASGNSSTATTLQTTRTIWGQNFNGSANISGNIIGAGTIEFGTQTNKATLTYTTNTARTYTIPDAGANADFVMNAGNQTIAGVKTFSGNTTFPNGALATPSINFTGSTNTGFYFATNQVSTSIAGAERLRVSNVWTYTPKLLVNTTSTSTEVFKVEGTSRLKDFYVNSSGQEWLIATNYGAGSGGRNIYIGNGGQFTNGTSSSFGSYNTSLGVYALSSVTIGRFNSAVGYASQQKSPTGQYNTSLGYASLYENLVGEQNTAIGSDALRNNKANYNTAVGSNSIDSLNDEISNNNTAVGCNSFQKITAGSNNTAIGYSSMGLGVGAGASENTAVGSSSLEKLTNGGANSVFGYFAARELTSGSGNCIFGHNAANILTTGIYNICIGALAAPSLTLGGENVLIGTASGGGITTGSNNVCIGGATQGNNNVSNSVSIGTYALFRNRDNGNIGIGYGAGSSSGNSGSATNLTFIGLDSGTYNDTGDNHTAVGSKSLYTNTTGSNNTAIGTQSLYNMLSSSNCVAVGVNALYECTGANNIGIGSSAGRLTGSGGASLTSGTNNIMIGYYSRPSVATGTNQIVIGNTLAGVGDNTVTIGAGTTYIHATITGTAGSASWTRVSDISLKKNINENNLGLNFIKKINPVTYNWIENNKLDKSNPHYREENEKDSTSLVLGLIAQNVKKAMDEEGADYFSGWSKESSGLQGISLEPFILPLINAVKELSERLEKLENKIK